MTLFLVLALTEGLLKNRVRKRKGKEGKGNHRRKEEKNLPYSLSQPFGESFDKKQALVPRKQTFSSSSSRVAGPMGLRRVSSHGHLQLHLWGHVEGKRGKGESEGS